MIWGFIPGRGKRFSSASRCPDRLWGPPTLLISGYQTGVLSLVGKVAGARS